MLDFVVIITFCCAYMIFRDKQWLDPDYYNELNNARIQLLSSCTFYNNNNSKGVCQFKTIGLSSRALSPCASRNIARSLIIYIHLATYMDIERYAGCCFITIAVKNETTCTFRIILYSKIAKVLPNCPPFFSNSRKLASDEICNLLTLFIIEERLYYTIYNAVERQVCIFRCSCRDCDTLCVYIVGRMKIKSV